TEWTKLFSGQSSQAYGRYGPDGQPGSAMGPTSPLPWTPWNFGPAYIALAPRFSSAMDTDATKGTSASPTRNPSDPFALPGTGSTLAYFPFPNYPSPSYTNGDLYEAANHPSLFNYFQPTGGDRVFQLNNMESLLRFGDTGTD